MSSFFTPNISGTGRVLRAIYGLLMLGGGIFVGLKVNPWLGVVLGFMGIFGLYEAMRGWCIMRACGIKTKY